VQAAGEEPLSREHALAFGNNALSEVKACSSYTHMKVYKMCSGYLMLSKRAHQLFIYILYILYKYIMIFIHKYIIYTNI
jgi:hypothetical protein